MKKLKNLETMMKPMERSIYSLHPGFERMGLLESPEARRYDPDALVEAMFSGAKSELRTLYDRLLTLGLGIGSGVKACPCKTIVPLYRRHVFAQLKPSTNSRIDLGLALKDTKAGGRLIDTGGRAKGDRITHRIPIVSAKDIDREVERWLQRAYDLDA